MTERERMTINELTTITLFVVFKATDNWH